MVSSLRSAYETGLAELENSTIRDDLIVNTSK